MVLCYIFGRMIQIRNKRIAVLGLGERATPWIRHFVKGGASVHAMGEAIPEIFHKMKEDLKGIKTELSLVEEWTPTMLRGFDYILPIAVPTSFFNDVLQVARQRGAAIYSEIEWVSAAHPIFTIGISG